MTPPSALPSLLLPVITLMGLVPAPAGALGRYSRLRRGLHAVNVSRDTVSGMETR